MKYPFITVEGNIGAGKTTLARMLADHFNSRLILEQFADNPFLPRFYEAPERYAFPLELFFLAERYQQLKEIIQERELFNQHIISDYLFTKSLLFAKVNLSEEEFQLYQRLFHLINTRLAQPDLLIYLHAPIEKLQENIRKRDRGYEQNISTDYLHQLQEVYLEYIRQHKLKTLLIDVSESDFQHQPEKFQTILDALEKEYVSGPNYLTL